MRNYVLDGVMGLCVGDALGVPVEFMDREVLELDPVIGMRSYGTYNQPAGTWSDDTSMTLCLLDSLNNGLDYNDIMENFVKWFSLGEYTPFNEAFDIGIGTRDALKRFDMGIPALECGGKGERDNGNGSLMRILPIVFYLKSNYGTEFHQDEIDEIFKTIHNISKLTHGHIRSQISCGIYISIAAMLFMEKNLKMAIDFGINRAIEYYENNDKFLEELIYFERLKRKDFYNISIDEINSSGYVVSTLEAAIWCLLNTNNYKDCVLKAVNLGNDTDTVGSVAGGLAGLHYGYSQIPEEWINAIIEREYIEGLCNKLNTNLNKQSIEKLTSYLPYFEKATRVSVCSWSGAEKLGAKYYNMFYPKYDPRFEKFVDEFYKSGLICYNYLDIIEKYGIKSKNKIIDVITRADLQLLRAILTGYIRQERFSDGLWADAVEDKIFYNILMRLEKLI